MKIIACMPSYKIMDVLAVRSLVAFQADIYGKGDNLLMTFTNGYTAAHGRNFMFKYAATQEADYVLSLDSDHIYSAKAIYTLIDKLEKNNYELLSAKYWARGDFRANSRVIAGGDFAKDGKFELRNPPEDETGIQEVDVMGLGFMLLRHSFVKKMCAKYKNLFYTNRFNDYADDVVFSRFCKDEGVIQRYDADTMIGHLSTVINI